MDDHIFIAALDRYRLLPGDIKIKIKLSQHRIQCAMLFLDTVIEPTIRAGVDRVFYQLLDAMDDCSYRMAMVQSLATEIRDELKKGKANSTS